MTRPIRGTHRDTLTGRLVIEGGSLKSYPTALVLEDDPTQLEEISQALAKCNLDVVAARSAGDARRRLEQRQSTPVIAIIDWNMQLSPDQSLSVPALLAWLRRFERGCHTIVYTGHPELLVVRNVVTEADPLAHYQDKRLGVGALVKRLQAIVGVTVGDLTLAGDAVTCTVTGQHYFHEIARRLMSSYPRELELDRGASLYRSAYRFRNWLVEQGSSVHVECMKHRRFRLVVGSGEASGN